MLETIDIPYDFKMRPDPYHSIDSADFNVTPRGFKSSWPIKNRLDVKHNRRDATK
jgi:hypothetical protein